MLYPLIYREYGHVARSGEPSSVVHELEVTENGVRPVGRDEYAIDKIWAGKVELVLGYGFALVVEKVIGLVSQELRYRIYPFRALYFCHFCTPLAEF